MPEISRTQAFKELEQSLDCLMKKELDVSTFLRSHESAHPLIPKLRERWEKQYESRSSEKTILETARKLLEYEDEVLAQEKRYGPLRSAISKTVNLGELREAERKESEFMESLVRVLEDYASSPLPVYRAMQG